MLFALFAPLGLRHIKRTILRQLFNFDAAAVHQNVFDRLLDLAVGVQDCNLRKISSVGLRINIAGMWRNRMRAAQRLLLLDGLHDNFRVLLNK